MTKAENKGLTQLGVRREGVRKEREEGKNTKKREREGEEVEIIKKTWDS